MRHPSIAARSVTTIIIAALVALPIAAPALTIEKNHYPDSVVQQGKQLNLVGAGLREKFFFDVYTLGLYLEQRTCDTKAIISKDQVKYFRIDMLRDVPADKMAEALKEAFDNNTPKAASAALKGKINKFVSYFQKECTEGTKLEFLYVPGSGTSLRQNGKELGPVIAGKDFADVLFSCYFSAKTCCSGLKKQILTHCKK